MCPQCPIAGDALSRVDTRIKLILGVELTKNTRQTTLEGAEGGSGDETIAKAGRVAFRVIPSVVTPGDTKLSDATDYI